MFWQLYYQPKQQHKADEYYVARQHIHVYAQPFPYMFLQRQHQFGLIIIVPTMFIFHSSRKICAIISPIYAELHVTQCPLPWNGTSINSYRLIHFCVLAQFWCRKSVRSLSFFPPYVLANSLYEANGPYVIQRVWIVAPVRIGLSSGPIVQSEWYQPASQDSSAVIHFPILTHFCQRSV